MPWSYNEHNRCSSLRQHTCRLLCSNSVLGDMVIDITHSLCDVHIISMMLYITYSSCHMMTLLRPMEDIYACEFAQTCMLLDLASSDIPPVETLSF